MTDCFAQAQSTATPAPAATVKPDAKPVAKPTATLVKPVVQPYWVQLTAEQRQTLAPIAADWENFDASSKKKWLQLADRYPHMKAEEQQRVQTRMREWMQLSTEQRRVARDSYVRARAIPPEKRAELLKKYQALPDEQKKQLATESNAGQKLVPHKPAAEPVPTHAQIRAGATSAKLGAKGGASGGTSGGANSAAQPHPLPSLSVTSPGPVAPALLAPAPTPPSTPTH